MQALRNLFSPTDGPSRGIYAKGYIALKRPFDTSLVFQNGKLNVYDAAVGKALRGILYQYSWQVKSLPILSSLLLYHIFSVKSILYLTSLN